MPECESLSVDKVTALFFVVLNFGRKEESKVATKKNRPAIRLNKANCQSGMDGINLEYTISLDGIEKLYLPTEEYKNHADNTIVKIVCIGGKVKAYVNPVHAIRANNVKPFSIIESVKLEMVREQVVEVIRTYLHKHLQNKYSDEFVDRLKIVRLECNTTMKTLGNATPASMLHFLNMVFDNTLSHQKRKPGTKCKKECNYVKFIKEKEYIVKCYNKTLEQQEHGNPLVESNLLRIELVFLSRSLNRMYGDKRTLNDVLTKPGLEILCREYKRVMTEDISEAVRKYRDDCKNMLVEYLTQYSGGNMVTNCIAEFKEEIVDLCILKRALQEYYRINNMADNSSQVLYYYKKKGILPQDVFNTFKEFRKVAG